MMRPAKALERPPCRTGSSPLHDAVGRRPRARLGGDEHLVVRARRARAPPRHAALRRRRPALHDDVLVRRRRLRLARAPLRRGVLRVVEFHLLAFEANKAASLAPTAIDAGPYADLVTDAFWDLWSTIFHHVWGVWRLENGLPDYRLPDRADAAGEGASARVPTGSRSTAPRIGGHASSRRSADHRW